MGGSRSQNNLSSWAGIIREVRGPVGLFALLVLVTEAILFVLASRATGLDFTLLTVGMVVIFALLVVMVAYLVMKRPEVLAGEFGRPTTRSTFRHDVFISSPMAAFDNDEEYRRERKNILRLMEAFRTECKFDSVVYAGQDIKSIDDFENADISVQEDLEALRDSKYFVLLYPRKLTSSVLVEAGCALTLGRKSIYLVRDRDDLPFLLRQAEMAFSTVKIYEVYDGTSIDKALKMFDRHGKDIFNFRKEQRDDTDTQVQ